MNDPLDRRRISFGPFVVDPVRRRLMRDGEPVTITPRAFDTLIVLMDGRGRVIEKDELMRVLWPDTVVEEINLNVQISTLRKALGEQPNDHRYIVTVPRRGYSFVADVVEVEEEPPVRPVVAETTTDGGENELVRGTDARLPAGRAFFSPRMAVAAACVALLAVTFVFLARDGMSKTGADTRTTIAVLPFRSLDGDTGEAIAVGLTDALITRLGTVENLRVSPTTAVLACAASVSDPIAAGRQLDVLTVLDGKLQSEGERLRVTVQLLDVRDGSTMWTETFDAPVADAFAAQDALAGRIGTSLGLQLASVPARVAGVRQENAEAYALYLRGRQHWNRRTDADIRIAIEYFRRSLDVEPNAALAWSGLADSYALLSVYGGLPADEAYAKAREAAERAIALDDGLSEAHASRAGVLFRYDGDYDGARHELDRAIELDPGNATAWQWYGELLILSGDPVAAIDRLRHASQLDSLSLVLQSDQAWALYYARRYDEAAELSRRVLWLDSGFRPARQCLALTLIQQGRHEEALQECARADLSGSAIAGAALAGLERDEQARMILQQLRWNYRQGRNGAYAAARVFAALGEPASAVRWLRHAARAKECQVAYMALEPAFDGLRDEPGFQRLVREISGSRAS